MTLTVWQRNDALHEHILAPLALETQPVRERRDTLTVRQPRAERALVTSPVRPRRDTLTVRPSVLAHK